MKTSGDKVAFAFLLQEKSKQMKTKQRAYVFFSAITKRKSLFINPSSEEYMFLWIQLKKQIICVPVNKQSPHIFV